MYKKHPSFEEPLDKNVKIWRYMDFYKFVSILEYNSLFFPNIKCLKKFDKMEGFLPNNVAKYISHPSLLYALKEARKTLFVNCWHINKIESYAMWKTYLNNNEGIAIQSTFERLKNSLAGYEKDIFFGKVKYIYSNDIKNKLIWEPKINAFNLVLNKRKSFEYISGVIFLGSNLLFLGSNLDIGQSL